MADTLRPQSANQGAPPIPRKSSRRLSVLTPITPITPSIITTHFELPSAENNNGTRTSPVLPSSPASIRSSSVSSHKSYLASLEVPSAEEHARIAEIQVSREDQVRRRSREERRHRSSRSNSSIDAAIVASLSRSQSVSPSSGGGKYVSRQTIGTLITAATAASTVPAAVASPTSAHAPKTSLSHRLGSALGTSIVLPKQNLEDFARSRAARIIQRNYRGYRTRRVMKGLCIDANTRWMHAIRELQYREATRPRPLAGEARAGDGEGRPDEDASTASTSTGTSTARKYWKKAAAVAKRANIDQDRDSDTDSDAGEAGEDGVSPRSSLHPSADARTMALPYFLEMVDPRHRYGPNLRVYHEVWQRSNTQENFFYWLDYGDGRSVDLGGGASGTNGTAPTAAAAAAAAGCPRSRLDREQVRYLSREERACYLVQVDGEGRLCWAKNGQRVDTTDGLWKDSVNGIVPMDDPTPAFRPGADAAADADADADAGADADDMGIVSESELEAARAAKYAMNEEEEGDEAGGGGEGGEGKHNKDGRKQQHKRHGSSLRLRVPHLSATAIFNSLLRKSIRNNTWIFVADTRFRLYVGLKEAGVFQHSSFLQGSRIAAAGLLQVQDGRLVSLSPLSGHYRPPAANFRAFVSSLREAGVADLERVRISKAYVVLAGLEAYTKTRQRRREWLGWRKGGESKDEEERGKREGKKKEKKQKD